MVEVTKDVLARWSEFAFSPQNKTRLDLEDLRRCLTEFSVAIGGIEFTKGKEAPSVEVVTKKNFTLFDLEFVETSGKNKWHIADIIMKKSNDTSTAGYG